MNKRSDISPVIASVTVDENRCFNIAVSVVAAKSQHVLVSRYRTMKISSCRLQRHNVTLVFLRQNERHATILYKGLTARQLQ
jgi:hypothetical protein